MIDRAAIRIEGTHTIAADRVSGTMTTCRVPTITPTMSSIFWKRVRAIIC